MRNETYSEFSGVACSSFEDNPNDISLSEENNPKPDLKSVTVDSHTENDESQKEKIKSENEPAKEALQLQIVFNNAQATENNMTHNIITINAHKSPGETSKQSTTTPEPTVNEETDDVVAAQALKKIVKEKFSLRKKLRSTVRGLTYPETYEGMIYR